MAKVSFGRLNLKKNEEVRELKLEDGVVIEIKQYLPIKEKLEMISEILNMSLQDTNIIDYGKLDVLMTFGIIKNYTNINFTEKQVEDLYKVFDLFCGSGLYKDILREIPKSEIEYLEQRIFGTAEEIIKYRNSAVGIVEAISNDYSNLNFDAEEIRSKISDPNNLALLKDVLTKLG